MTSLSFSDAKAWIDSKKDELKSSLSNETALKLYGLYKQSIIGDVNQPQPWAIEFEARAKWDAWNSMKGVRQEQAKQQYVNVVEKLKKKY